MYAHPYGDSRRTHFKVEIYTKFTQATGHRHFLPGNTLATTHRMSKSWWEVWQKKTALSINHKIVKKC